MTGYYNAARMPSDANGHAVQVLTPISTEKLALSNVAASAAALSSTTNVIRIISDTPCFYRLDGTATTSHTYLPADTIEYLKLSSGNTLSVILASGTGNMYISECV